MLTTEPKSVFSVSLDVLLDLHYELAGRGKDKGAGRVLSCWRYAVKAMQQWQRKCCGLARACLGDAYEIVALENFGNGSSLDGGRFCVTCFLDGLQNEWMKTERLEWHGNVYSELTARMRFVTPRLRAKVI